MRWRVSRRSENVEDRRGEGSSMSMGLGGVRLGGAGLVAALLLALVLGVDPTILLQGIPTGSLPGSTPEAGAERAPRSAEEEELAEFVSFVLGDIEDTWQELFRQAGREYEEPKLVLFSGAVNSACGFAQVAMGPFYCPADQKVYIDLAFYDEMRNRFRAPGDFAQAYVIAHEVGHHVQNLLGISDQVRRLQGRVDEVESNQLSVRQELQADCLAGVWAHHADRARQVLEAGDVEEALGAASAIGDDRMQRQSRGYVTPDSFTHGSSAQRVRWFKRGLQEGQLSACETFATEEL